MFSGDEAEPCTPSVAKKSKSRKDALATLAAARKKSGSTASQKRKERRTKRSGGKEWRKTVNEISPEGNNESDRFVAEKKKKKNYNSNSTVKF